MVGWRGASSAGGPGPGWFRHGSEPHFRRHGKYRESERRVKDAFCGVLMRGPETLDRVAGAVGVIMSPLFAWSLALISLCLREHGPTLLAFGVAGLAVAVSVIPPYWVLRRRYGVVGLLFAGGIEAPRRRDPIMLVSLLVGLLNAAIVVGSVGGSRRTLGFFLGVLAVAVTFYIATLVGVTASGHVTAAAGLATSVCVVWHMAWAPCLLAVPLVGWARVRNGVHTRREVIAGSLIGTCIPAASALFFFLRAD